MHCRYIDDGFLVWTGSLERLNALRAELAAVDPRLQRRCQKEARAERGT
eukprot:COSAG01_NODE_45500_length_409_cov_0.361290_1_plen_48_part_01